jgi:hypothetical protein
VELGGALKNVLAIACGISDGLNLGSNARAALITRGGRAPRAARAPCAAPPQLRLSRRDPALLPPAA